MIMDRLRECKRMVKRTRWIDARLMELQCGTERTNSALNKTPPETEDSIALEMQLDKITGFERHYSAQLIEAMQEIMELDGWMAVTTSGAARGYHAAAVYRCPFME